VIKPPDIIISVPTRRYHTAWVIGQSMVIHGGLDELGMVLGDSYIFDFEQKEWQKLNIDGLGPLAYHTSALVYYKQQLQDPSVGVYHIPKYDASLLPRFSKIARPGVY
jgi:hypothetical protein